MSEDMDTKLLASLAIVAALALVGVVAVQVLAVQEAFAQPTGCKPGSHAFKTNKENCFHTPGERR